MTATTIARGAKIRYTGEGFSVVADSPPYLCRNGGLLFNQETFVDVSKLGESIRLSCTQTGLPVGVMIITNGEIQTLENNG